MRHSDRAVQLPTSASGNRLCRHASVGSCTRYCSYKLFVKVVLIAVVVLAVICAAVWLGGDEGEGRIRDVLLGVGGYLALVIPGIVIANSRDRD